MTVLLKGHAYRARRIATSAFGLFAELGVSCLKIIGCKRQDRPPDAAPMRVKNSEISKRAAQTKS